MFEHFGLMDVFCAIKRYFKLIVAVVVIAALIFGLNAFRSLKNSNLRKVEVRGKIYASESSYYFEPVIKPELSDSDIYTLDMYRDLPGQYSGMLNTDLCKNYIVERLTEKYSLKELTEKSSLVLDKNKNKIDINSLSNVSFVGQDKSAPLLNISVETYDANLSEYIVTLYSDYLLHDIGSQTDWINIKPMGSFQKETDSSSISSENQSSLSKLFVKTMVKKVVVPVIGVLALALISIFFVALFCPTINRKSDFYEYGMPVIANLRKCKKRR